jgi:hypothetical protein
MAGISLILAESLLFAVGGLECQAGTDGTILLCAHSSWVRNLSRGTRTDKFTVVMRRSSTARRWIR